VYTTTLVWTLLVSVRERLKINNLEGRPEPRTVAFHRRQCGGRPQPNRHWAAATPSGSIQHQTCKGICITTQCRTIGICISWVSQRL
jgi:hypothetical protein